MARIDELRGKMRDALGFEEGEGDIIVSIHEPYVVPEDKVKIVKEMVSSDVKTFVNPDNAFTVEIVERIEATVLTVTKVKIVDMV